MDDPIAFLFSLERLGMKFGLGNIATLCAALGHPERAFRSILVAGTNGKGSVTAIVEAALTAAGCRAARYTSPHLVRLEERFVILGEEVDRRALASSAALIREVVQGLLAKGTLQAPPTFFECTTAVAFDLFREAGVDVAVLEVGLGGRLDSTNIVSPAVTAITSIDFDHQALLGDTLAAIAAEKAGIIKPRIPVVCGPLPPEADAVVRRAAAAVGAPFIAAAERVSVSPRPGRTTVDVRTPTRALKGIEPALPGAHQRRNAAVAVAVLEAVAQLGVSIPDEAVVAGLERVRWPGRLERLDLDGTPVILDAAHNPAGAAALALYLDEAGLRDLTLIVGVMRDKDARGMLEALAGREGRWGAIICTTPPGDRSLGAAALSAIAREATAGRVAVEAVADPRTALARAAHRGRPIVAAGSIFLIGPLRDILR